MNSYSQQVVERWFVGLTNSNTGDLLDLFAPSSRICNAANPPSEGTDAASLLLKDFFRRTTRRQFSVIDMAEGDGQIFACWQGELVFASGITIGDIVLKKELPITLRGVERFKLDAAGKIVELDIVHETTSVYLAAQRAAQEN